MASNKINNGLFGIGMSSAISNGLPALEAQAQGNVYNQSQGNVYNNDLLKQRDMTTAINNARSVPIYDCPAMAVEALKKVLQMQVGYEQKIQDELMKAFNLGRQFEAAEAKHKEEEKDRGVTDES